MKNLRDKAILVCGGATGIGAATVRRLSAEGARVGIGDLNIEGATALAEELTAAGGDVVAWRYDQTRDETIEALVASAVGHFGRLDGLFANVADIGAVRVQISGDVVIDVDQAGAVLVRREVEKALVWTSDFSDPRILHIHFNRCGGCHPGKRQRRSSNAACRPAVRRCV